MDLFSIYQERIDTGILRDDPAQRAILPEFERVRGELAAPVKKGFFRKAPPPPKGIYLWGGVGSGKSMMMDLFVESLTVPVRRVHFHAFMQEVQTGIHIARESNVRDPIRFEIPRLETDRAAHAEPEEVRVGNLESIEQLPWRIFYSRLDLESLEHPTLKITLELNTLSLEQEWLGV